MILPPPNEFEIFSETLDKACPLVSALATVVINSDNIITKTFIIITLFK